MHKGRAMFIHSVNAFQAIPGHLAIKETAQKDIAGAKVFMAMT